SRAEYRLLLRHDNADVRLTPVGREIGLVSDERYRRFERTRAAIDETRARLENGRVTATDNVQRTLEAIGSRPLKDGHAPTLADLLRRPELSIDKLAMLEPSLADLDEEVRERVELEIKYEGYIARQEAQVDRFRKLESKRIPSHVDYAQIPGLSREAR